MHYKKPLTTNYIRVRSVSCETNEFARTQERLLDCLDDLDDRDADLSQWIDSLEELSEIVDAFGVEEGKKLHGKTILDIGTDCVKPLYIALKFEPDKIIGINEYLSRYSFASDLEKKSRLFTKTKIHLYDCSFFDEVGLEKIQRKDTFDFVLLSKTLHHLRAGECNLAEKRDQKHKCREDEKHCIYKFEEKEIFDRLLRLGKRVIIYEWFDPTDEDTDKVRGRGGYFTIREWRNIFRHLSENYRVEFVKPLRCRLDKKEFEKVIAKLRQVDCVCFYVETK